MLCYASTSSPTGAHKVRLEPTDVGVYVFVWLHEASKTPEYDHLQDTLDMAKLSCAEDYGIPVENWTAYDDPNALTQPRSDR